MSAIEIMAIASQAAATLGELIEMARKASHGQEPTKAEIEHAKDRAKEAYEELQRLVQNDRKD